jgi:hypothetical protein
MGKLQFGKFKLNFYISKKFNGNSFRFWQNRFR